MVIRVCLLLPVLWSGFGFGGGGGVGAADASIDYYQVLGVGKKAPVAEIRKQYKSLAKQWHPDKVKGDEAAKLAAQEKFMAINEAHEVLSDPSSRREYDEDRASGGVGGRRGFPFHNGGGNNFHFHSFQRAQQYHWQQHHQYRQSPPVTFSLPLVAIVLVPLVYLIFSAVAKDREGDTGETATGGTSRGGGRDSSTGAKTKKPPKKPPVMVMTPMQQQQIQFAPDLVQVCRSYVRSVGQLVSARAVGCTFVRSFGWSVGVCARCWLHLLTF